MTSFIALHAGHIHSKAPAATAIGFTLFGTLACVFGASIPAIYGLIRKRRIKKDQESQQDDDKKFPDWFIAGSLSFGAGSLIFGSLFHVLQDGVNSFAGGKITTQFAAFAAMASMLSGIGMFLIMEKALLWLAPDIDCPCHGGQNKCECVDEAQCGCLDGQEGKDMRTTSWLTFLVMTLHHLPEGLAFYLSSTSDLKSGAIIGIILLAHLLPEGVTIGIPACIAFPDQPWKGVFSGLLAGLALPLGAFIGYLAVGLNDVTISQDVLGFIYSLISGMLLTIAFKGFLPYARKLSVNPCIINAGLIFGALWVFLSIALLNAVNL